jgi:hypothetical protein
MTQVLPKLSPEMLVPRMGEYLIQKGLITTENLQKALAYQQESIASGSSILLGQALLDLKLIDRSISIRRLLNRSCNCVPPCKLPTGHSNSCAGTHGRVSGSWARFRACS